MADKIVNYSDDELVKMGEPVGKESYKDEAKVKKAMDSARSHLDKALRDVEGVLGISKNHDSPTARDFVKKAAKGIEKVITLFRTSDRSL